MTEQDGANGPGEDSSPAGSRVPPGDSPEVPRTRHRRRRAPGDPTTTGSIPIIRTPAGTPDPTVDYRRPEPSQNPYLEIRYAQPTLPDSQVNQPGFAEPPPAPPAPRHDRRRPEPPRAEPPRAEPPPPRPAPPEPRTAFAEPPTVPAPVARPRQPVSPADVTPTAPTTSQFPAEPAAHRTEPAPADVPAPEPIPAVDDAQPVPSGATTTFDILDESPSVPAAAPPGDWDGPDGPDGPDGFGGFGDDEDPRGMPAPHKRHKALIAVIAVIAVVLLAAVIGLRQVGVFDSRKDFDSTTGGTSALVEIPEQSSLRDFGRILADAGVVGSQRAFVDAAGDRQLSAGYYTLPTGISGSAAVDMMEDGAHRVGRLVIPEGLQLDSKKGVDGKTTPGIFEMLADVTSVEADGRQYGVTVEELQKAAAEASADDLGVPKWAASAVERLDNDHRRIEGLIASGAWEEIDPRQDATELLHSLITRSTTRFETWGLLNANESGLMPYDTLIVASIVEREVSNDDDYGKAARVILNRLDEGQKLEMDSTANYTAQVTNIDVHGEAYTDKTEWNTYQRDGLPVTPIGAVGERALEAVENPATGDWLYFVTVDSKGTTLFAKSFDRHKKNRQIACRNKFITTGCN